MVEVDADSDGKLYQQYCRKGDKGLCVLSNVAPMGVSVFDPHSASAKTPHVTVKSIDGGFEMENQYLRVRVSSAGHLLSLFDKECE